MMKEIYDISSTKPLHIRVGMWHTQLAEKDEAIPILDSNCKFVSIMRQKLLKAIDPTGTRPLEDVLDETEIHAEKIQAVIEEECETQTALSLGELLDIFEIFIL